MFFVMQANYLILVICLLSISFSLTAANDQVQGVEFLREVAQRPDIHQLKSGMLVEILTSSDKPDAKSPKLEDSCEVTYKGTLIDGKLFDQSNTSVFAPNEVIKGWTEAMQMMTEGDKWKLYIPYYLAYGETGFRVIPPFSALVFELELVKVVDGGKPSSEAKAMFNDALGEPEDREVIALRNKEKGEEFLLEVAQRPDIHQLKSGMLVEILTTSDKIDAKSPTVADICEVNYKGTFIDGKLFDQDGTSFAPNEVIRGWTEAMQMMVEGDKWKLYIPYNLAYGEKEYAGLIPAYSPLVFDLELVKVVDGGKNATDARAMFQEALVEVVGAAEPMGAVGIVESMGAIGSSEL